MNAEPRSDVTVDAFVKVAIEVVRKFNNIPAKMNDFENPVQRNPKKRRTPIPLKLILKDTVNPTFLGAVETSPPAPDITATKVVSLATDIVKQVKIRVQEGMTTSIDSALCPSIDNQNSRQRVCGTQLVSIDSPHDRSPGENDATVTQVVQHP